MFLNNLSIFIFTNLTLFIGFIFIILAVILNKNLTKKKIVILFTASFFIFLVYSCFLTLLQYKMWENSPIMKYALPPNNNLNYFLLYSYHAFFKELTWRIIGAFLTFVAIFVIDKLFRGTLFYPEEFYLIPFLEFLIDFPVSLLLLPFALVILIFVHIFKTKNSMLKTKQSFKPYWPFAALLVIISNIILVYLNLIYKIQP